MVAMMLVPDGVTAAAVGSSVIWKIVGRAVEDRGMALDMEGEDRRADHDDEIVRRAARPTVAPARHAGSRRIADAVPGNEQRAENGLTQTAALVFSATCTIRSTAPARSTPGPTTRAGCLLAASAATSAFIASGSGPSLAADVAGLDRLRRMGPVVDRHRDEGRPAGRLHRDVIGARDRGRHVFGPRRLDAVFDIGPRKFRGALGIEEGLQRQDAARLLARGDHQRRLVAVRGVDVAERVADAGRRMQVDEAGVARGLRIAVGHADHGGFLQAQHIVDVVGPVAEERQFGRAGIAEHLLDAERAQQVEAWRA